MTQFNWIAAPYCRANELECHYQAKRGDVVLGTITDNNNGFYCKANTGLIDEVVVIERSFAKIEHAKMFVESGGRMSYCAECDEMHYDNSFCECKACLYKNSKQIPDEMYPFFRCTKCKKVNFWD